MPSTSSIWTRALRLMSGNSGMRLASGKESSSVTLTSRTLDWQTDPVGEVQSAAPGFESLSYQSDPFRIA